jgi:hypothetical protein
VGVCLSLAVGALAAWATPALGASPNDNFFRFQWAEGNTGQLIPLQEPPGEELKEEVPGSLAADDRVTEAWRVTTGSRSTVIGEVDTGVNYLHPDLAANIWNNPDGKAGCPAGTHGYNVVDLLNPCNPMDTESGGYGGHGTHVAGIMGAVGNNEIGVAGVNWQTTILPVRWLQSAKSGGAVSDLITGLKWLVKAKQEGVNIRVVNDSPNFESEQPALREAIKELASNNILFVTAAGNSVKPYYPCAYDLPNEICVTATNNRDELPSWANYEPYGPGIDLAAPGESIFSTTLHEYGYLSGGSMAAAQVSGAAALILSVAPGLTAEQLRADILNNADPLPALRGKVEAGGRLDVCKAMPGCPPPPPTPPPAPAPPPPPPAPAPQLSTVAITSRFLKVHHGMIRVGLRCSGPTACASKLALVVNVKVKVKKTSGRETRTSIKKMALTIGTATFAAQPGGTVRVTIKPNAIGRKILASGSGRLYVNLTIFASVPAPPATQTQRVELVWKPARSPAK